MTNDEYKELDALVVAAKAGQPLAVNRLLVNSRPYFLKVVHRLLQDRNRIRLEVEDIVQEALMQIVRDLAGMQTESYRGYLGWACIVVRNNAYKAIEKQMAWKRGSGWTQVEWNDRKVSREPNQIEHAIAKETLGQMETVAKTISERGPRVLQMLTDGHRIDEMATEMSCSYSTVKKFLRRFRKRAEDSVRVL